ncbi:hypothetical protein ABLN67_03250 [Mycobacterium tuberculosis]
MFNRFIYRREWSFRIYRETLSRFSCASNSSKTASSTTSTCHRSS